MSYFRTIKALIRNVGGSKTVSVLQVLSYHQMKNKILWWERKSINMVTLVN